MTLRDWMDQNGRDELWLADMVGEPVAEVRSWLSGRLMPNPVQRQHVSHVTKGQVDWTGTLAVLARGTGP